MVIEYIGTLIRNEVANKWERDYEAANRGVYMFRIDDYTVVDATRSGNPARYINHSCNPNCVAEVVNFDKDQKKIIIISSRRLLKGEEVGLSKKHETIINIIPSLLPIKRWQWHVWKKTFSLCCYLFISRQNFQIFIEDKGLSLKKLLMLLKMCT